MNFRYSPILYDHQCFTLKKADLKKKTVLDYRQKLISDGFVCQWSTICFGFKPSLNRI